MRNRGSFPRVRRLVCSPPTSSLLGRIPLRCLAALSWAVTSASALSSPLALRCSQHPPPRGYTVCPCTTTSSLLFSPHVGAHIPQEPPENGYVSISVFILVGLGTEFWVRHHHFTGPQHPCLLPAAAMLLLVLHDLPLCRVLENLPQHQSPEVPQATHRGCSDFLLMLALWKPSPVVVGIVWLILFPLMPSDLWWHRVRRVCWDS